MCNKSKQHNSQRQHTTNELCCFNKTSSGLCIYSSLLCRKREIASTLTKLVSQASSVLVILWILETVCGTCFPIICIYSISPAYPISSVLLKPLQLLVGTFYLSFRTPELGWEGANLPAWVNYGLPSLCCLYSVFL